MNANGGRTRAPGSRRWPRGCAIIGAVVVAAFSTTLAAGGSVTYVYDALGRLVDVRDDSSGQIATYTYDPAGNITAIGVNSPVLTFVSFTPACGPAGTGVTIFGSGFGTAPGADIVSFNGVGANVTQATSTQLVVSVPPGNTAGPITVTVGAQTRTSPAPFGGPCGSPTITGFSPTSGVAAASGAPGTTVVITGTNFQTRPTDNVVNFGVTRAVVTSSSATTLTTTVPEAASSGRISVATPYGQFLSTSYFIVVPIGRAAADIDTTARAVIRQNVTVSIRAPGHIAMVLFDGTEGERVDVVGTPIGPWRLQLMGPYGAIDGSNAPCGSSAMYLRPTVLPATGTYAIVVDDPSGVATGSPTVTVYDVADSTITTRTSAITPVTISVPGQKTNIEFVAIPGLPVSAVVTANGLSCPVASGCNVYASIVRPDGGYLHDPVRIDGTGFLDSRTITVAGVHTLVLDPGPNTGTATVEIFRLTRPRIKRWRIGHRAAFHAHRPGMNIHYTFAGLAGQQIAIQRSSETFPPGTADLYLANPDGSPLVLPTRGNIGPTTLPQTGTYVVMFDPIGAATGAVILTLDDCSAGPC